jgi:hypothetical protein
VSIERNEVLIDRETYRRRTCWNDYWCWS